MRQMRHVGHSVRWITIESLKIVLMGTDNHQVRANVEFMARRTICRLPSAEIHVRDADTIDLRRAAGKAVLYPVHENRVEARWLIVRISRNSWKTGPFARPFAQEPVFPYRRRGPIAHSRVLGDECGTASQRIRDLLRVSHRQSI